MRIYTNGIWLIVIRNVSIRINLSINDFEKNYLAQKLSRLSKIETC